MATDDIAEIGIDDEQRLFVRPATATFPHIYREALDVHWDAARRHLHSPMPREWTHLQWFQHIIGAAAIHSHDLRITPATLWTNIPAGLRDEIDTWVASHAQSAP